MSKFDRTQRRFIERSRIINYDDRISSFFSRGEVNAHSTLSRNVGEV